MDPKTMEQPDSPLRGFFMWLCAAIFYGFQFILRVSPSVMAQDLMSSLAVEACTLGALSSFYYWGYSIMQVPAGLLLDSIGPKKPLSLACILCFFGALLFAGGQHIGLLSLGRFLMGIGSAFGFLTCIRIASTWFPAEKLAVFVGFTLAIGTAGATSGGLPLALLVQATSWQTAIYILAGISLALAIVIWVVIADEEPSFKNLGQEALSKSLFSLNQITQSILEIARNPQTWLFGAYGFLMYIPLSGFADLWGVPYLMQAFNVDREVAAGALSTFYVGVGIGGPLWSWILTFFKSYRRSMIVSAFVTFLFLSIVIYAPHLSFKTVYGLFFIAGAASSGQFLAFASITDINARDRAATASGVHNMLCMFSGILMQPIIGAFLDFLWDGDRIAGNPYYSLSDYRLALAIVPLSLVLAGLCVLFIRETYPAVKEKLLSQER
jgi:MFS family permease